MYIILYFIGMAASFFIIVLINRNTKMSVVRVPASVVTIFTIIWPLGLLLYLFVYVSAFIGQCASCIKQSEKPDWFINLAAVWSKFCTGRDRSL
ncbi:MAG: hypothetical protein DRO87_08505 [Candidatus Thorarchaeota archaeon]|nr:MAG: hypothetical protein DRO87_08505 [Candidatus Thorarchaeota archaeon]